MAVVLKTVVLTKADLVKHLRDSGVLVREYGIYPPYSVLDHMGDIRIDGNFREPQEEEER